MTPPHASSPAHALAITDDVAAARAKADASERREAARAVKPKTRVERLVAIVGGVVATAFIGWHAVDRFGTPTLTVGAAPRDEAPREAVATKAELRAVEDRLTLRIDGLYGLLGGKPPK